MKRFQLGRLHSVLVLLAAACLSSHVPAQSFPAKPLRMVIGFPAGGGIDIVGRTIAPKMGEALGQPVVIDNRAGANGILAADNVAKSAPDGHTMLFATTGNLSVNPALYANLPFNVERDFAPVSLVSSVPFLLYVHPSVPVQSLAELIALAKASPGRVNFYSSGSGGLPHLAGELLNAMAGIKTAHVPYKGSAPGLNDLIAGHVQFGFDSVPIGLPHVRAGKLRAIATTGTKRLAVLPEVPTAAETIPGYEVVNWYGMVLPAGTPREVVNRVHDAIVRALKDPETNAKLAAAGTESVGSSPEEFGALMKADAARWAKVVREANIKAD